eukprot:PhF_6_TR3163/c0_g1_i1/m.4561
MFNTIHSHWRSRAEHAFARNRLGRWGAFKDWKWSFLFLKDALDCCMIAMNIELFLDKGLNGRYAPMTPLAKTCLLTKATHHVIQDKRYPQPQQKPLPAKQHSHVNQRSREN